MLTLVTNIQSGAALEKGEVVVEICSTGDCGSDVHFWHAGRIGPMVVEDKHRYLSVTHLRPGDRVAIEPGILCHTCAPCLLPPSLSFEDGALLEPLSVALVAVKRADLQLGDAAVVWGRSAGAHPLVTTNFDAGRLAFAESLAPGPLAARVVEAMGGTEPDVALDAEIQAVRFGGTVFVVGVGKNGMQFPFMWLSMWEYANTWSKAIRLAEAGLLGDIRKFVMHRFPIEECGTNI
ncbi:GroES-like protein [Lactarius vividus]|nr:GroES-like protein [Lactarius vividus]